MVVEATGIAAAVLVVAAVAVAVIWWRRARGAGAALEVVRPQPTSWRLLETDSELRDALERALRSERAAVERAQQRADRVVALRARLGSVAVRGAAEQVTTRVS